MADPIKTFAINAAGPNPNGSYDVTVASWCKRVLVQENYDSSNPPTDDLLQYSDKGSTTPARIPKGTPAIFTTTGIYYPGQVIGCIKAAAGSVTVQQIEGAAV